MRAGATVVNVDIERLYEVLPWPMRPDDPEAKARFSSLIELFNFLLDNNSFFKLFRVPGVYKVLDSMAGSGIAGAALAKALASRGCKVYLTVSDARSADLHLVHEWL